MYGLRWVGAAHVAVGGILRLDGPADVTIAANGQPIKTGF